MNLLGTDMPLDALTAAANRARVKSIDDRVVLIAAAVANQSFRPSSVDAIVHTDMLC